MLKPSQETVEAASRAVIAAGYNPVTANVISWIALTAAYAIDRPDEAAILDWPCELQFKLATRVAANVGYVLTPESSPLGDDTDKRPAPDVNKEMLAALSRIRQRAVALSHRDVVAMCDIRNWADAAIASAERIANADHAGGASLEDMIAGGICMALACGCKAVDDNSECRQAARRYLVASRRGGPAPEDYDSEAVLAAGARLLPHSIKQAREIMDRMRLTPAPALADPTQGKYPSDPQPVGRLERAADHYGSCGRNCATDTCGDCDLDKSLPIPPGSAPPPGHDPRDDFSEASDPFAAPPPGIEREGDATDPDDLFAKAMAHGLIKKTKGGKLYLQGTFRAVAEQLAPPTPQAVVAEPKKVELAKRIGMHVALRLASPGFHLSDDELLMCADALLAASPSPQSTESKGHDNG